MNSFRSNWNFLAVLGWTALSAMLACNADQQTSPDSNFEVIECEDRLDCPDELGCANGICGRCERGRDCLVTEYCHPIDRLCYPNFVGDCSLNQDCDLGSFCVQGVCKKAADVVTCIDQSDCLENERCDQLNLVCVVDFGCNRDEDCAANEVCNLASNRCESACTPETQDVICGFGLVCDEFGRCVECFEDSQCGVGLKCNIETNRCEGENSCVTNRDCYLGKVCNPQTKQCTEAPPDCLSTADCPNGTVCDPPSGKCISADCRPDPNEPNDSVQTATVLFPGRTQELVLCSEDVDWFTINLARGDRLQVIVSTDFLASDHLRVMLFTPGADEVLQEDTLIIDQVVAQDAAYPLRVQSSDPQSEYSLIVTVSRGIPCDDDNREPNDSALDAAAISTGVFGSLAICPRDEDWYVLERTPNEDLRVTIEFPPLQGDLDLDLLAGDGQTLIMRSATAGGQETVFAPNGPSTRFFIRVYADSQIGNRYEMKVELTPSSR